jgi:formate hydrogenlyase transcriptional activator
VSQQPLALSPRESEGAIRLKADQSPSGYSPEIARYQTLLEAGTTLLSNLEEPKPFFGISDFLQTVVHPDFASLGLYEESTHCVRRHVLDSPLAQEFAGPPALVPLAEAPCSLTFLHGETRLLARNDFLASSSQLLRRFLEVGIQSACFLPLIARRGTQGALALGSTREHTFTLQDVSFLRNVAIHVAVALENAQTYRDVADRAGKLTAQNFHLQDELREGYDPDEIVGQSPALTEVLAQVRTFAANDAPILITGEMGTGKELSARAIHRMSARNQGRFVKVNCAAVPTGLLESEIFGYEKDAFTGAIRKQIGRVELAQQGTLFLEEVGDIPDELQPKLLRLLQAGEFERVGGTKTIKADVRLIASSTRDLANGMAASHFPAELYRALSACALYMPALRDRSQDVRLLARYFAHKFAWRMNRRIETIPREALRALESWHWPGNVRELEILMERAVILSLGSMLTIPIAELNLLYVPPAEETTLGTMEREHILRVLRETGGEISGTLGAAARLGMKPNTLKGRMKKLGIKLSDYQD